MDTIAKYEAFIQIRLNGFCSLYAVNVLAKDYKAVIKNASYFDERK